MTPGLKRRLTLIAVVIGGLALFGVNHAMSILDVKLPLTGAWKERFQDVQKLNDYAKTKPVELSNVKIENKTIDGAVISSGLFKATDWKNVSAKKSNLTKVVFRDGLLENVDFRDSILTDVVFEDVTLEEVRFVNTTLVNVRFIHCTLNGVNIDQTKNSRIEVSRSRVINTSLSDGQLIASFKNSILTRQTSLTDLSPPSSLTFEKSELEEVNMDRSKLKELIVNESKIKASHFRVANAEYVTIRNSAVDVGFSESKITNLEVNQSSIKRLMLNYVNIKQISLTNCDRVGFLGMAEASVGTFNSVRCPFSEFNPIKSNIGTLSVKDGSIMNSNFVGMKAKSMILDTVTLDGELDFTGAHVGELKATNVTKGPGLKLITTGSNVKF